MDIEKMDALLQAESGLRICKVCGKPFRPYHSRQKTCGEEECKRLHHNEYVKKYGATMKDKYPEKYKASKRNYARRSRQKKKALQARENQLKDLSERWKKQSDFDAKVSEYGLNYGKVQAEKILANVPKINLTIGDNSNGNENDKNE